MPHVLEEEAFVVLRIDVAVVLGVEEGRSVEDRQLPHGALDLGIDQREPRLGVAALA